MTPAERSNSPPIIRSATGHRDDPVLRGLVGPLARDPEIGQPVRSPRRPREQEVHRDRADERTQVGPLGERRQQVDARETFVWLGPDGDVGHRSRLLPAGWAASSPPTPLNV